MTAPAVEVVVQHDHDTGYHQASGEIVPAVDMFVPAGRFLADRVEVAYSRTRTDGAHGLWSWTAWVSGMVPRSDGTIGVSVRWAHHSSDDDPRDVPPFLLRYVRAQHPDRRTR